jgi:hypothetical protein
MTLDLIDEAVALIKAGQNEEARELLHAFIEAHMHNIPAWLLEVETWTTVEEKKKVLKLCLRFNPGAPQILQALAALEPAAAPRLAAPSASAPFLNVPVSNPPLAQSAKAQAYMSRHRQDAPVALRDRLIIMGVTFVPICLFVLFYLALISTTCIELPGAKACTRVLFIGNSFTQANDLPGTFAQLASSGGHKVDAQMAATGGWTLTQHATSPDTLKKVQSAKWNFIVLQEQSQIPSVEPSRNASMYPGARILVGQVKAIHAIPIFFQTWAHSAGWPENGMPDYENMQAQIDYGYQHIAQELNVAIAPAGFTWMMARRQAPQINLWQDDGVHPNEQGTYLAACVFYATIFRQSPQGLSYTGHLPQETARALQTLAANVVLQDAKQWNLY